MHAKRNRTVGREDAPEIGLSNMPKLAMPSVAIGALFLFALLGFIGVSADNTQYLLGAAERIDSEFLANDWFVQATQSFHPFFELYMAWWLRADQLTAGLFTWYAVNLVALSAALVVLLRYLGVEERLPYAVIVAAAMLLAGVRHGWGMYEVLTAQALPAYLAYPPAVMSVVLLCRRRYLFAALATTTTFLIHYGLGALMVLCLIGPLVVTLPRSRREIVESALGALLVLAVFLPVVLGTVNKDAGEASQFTILFYGRSPQHFAVQFSDLRTHMGSLHIFVSSLVLASILTSKDVRVKFLALIASIGALCALGYLLLEVWYTPVFVRLFPYRALPVLVVLNSCIIASLLLAEAPSRRDSATVTLVALSSICFAYGLSVSMLLLGAAVIARWALPSGDAATPKNARTSTLITCVAGALALLHSTIVSPPPFFPEWPSATQRIFSQVLAEHTPENAIIVVPPWLSGIRMTARRAIVVNLKNFPVFGPEMAAWADRIRDVSGIDPRSAKRYLQEGADIWQLYNAGYHSRSVSDLTSAARKYGARYILVSTNSRFYWEAQRIPFSALWSGNGFALYETPQETVGIPTRTRQGS